MKLILFLVILQNIFHGYQFSACKNRGITFNFEYGANSGQISFSLKGVVQVLEKAILRVPIQVGECKKLVYVEVETQNSLGPPHVWVDWDQATVQLNYRNIRLRDSCYAIVAKTILLRNCQSHKNDMEKNYWPNHSLK